MVTASQRKPRLSTDNAGITAPRTLKARIIRSPLFVLSTVDGAGALVSPLRLFSCKPAPPQARRRTVRQSQSKAHSHVPHHLASTDLGPWMPPKFVTPCSNVRLRKKFLADGVPLCTPSRPRLWTPYSEALSVISGVSRASSQPTHAAPPSKTSIWLLSPWRMRFAALPTACPRVPAPSPAVSRSNHPARGFPVPEIGRTSPT
jgi:hypothetical protein